MGRLKNYINISKSIEKLGVSVSTPIETIDGNQMIEDGQLYFVLAKRLQGKPIKAVNMYEGDYKNKARFIGEIIGQLSLSLEKVDV